MAAASDEKDSRAAHGNAHAHTQSDLWQTAQCALQQLQRHDVKPRSRSLWLMGMCSRGCAKSAAGVAGSETGAMATKGAPGESTGASVADPGRAPPLRRRKSTELRRGSVAARSCRQESWVELCRCIRHLSVEVTSEPRQNADATPPEASVPTVSLRHIGSFGSSGSDSDLSAFSSSGCACNASCRSNSLDIRKWSDLFGEHSGAANASCAQGRLWQSWQSKRMHHRAPQKWRHCIPSSM